MWMWMHIKWGSLSISWLFMSYHCMRHGLDMSYNNIELYKLLLKEYTIERQRQSICRLCLMCRICRSAKTPTKVSYPSAHSTQTLYKFLCQFISCINAGQKPLWKSVSQTPKAWIHWLKQYSNISMFWPQMLSGEVFCLCHKSSKCLFTPWIARISTSNQAFNRFEKFLNYNNF